MIRSIFILCILLLTGINASKGAQERYNLLSHEEGVILLQTVSSGTQSGDAFPVQDLNEDENDLILTLPFLHYSYTLAISNTHEHSTASLAAEVIPRPPRA